MPRYESNNTGKELRLLGLKEWDGCFLKRCRDPVLTRLS